MIQLRERGAFVPEGFRGNQSFGWFLESLDKGWIEIDLDSAQIFCNDPQRGKVEVIPITTKPLKDEEEGLSFYGEELERRLRAVMESGEQDDDFNRKVNDLFYWLEEIGVSFICIDPEEDRKKKPVSSLPTKGGKVRRIGRRAFSLLLGLGLTFGFVGEVAAQEEIPGCQDAGNPAISVPIGQKHPDLPGVVCGDNREWILDPEQTPSAPSDSKLEKIYELRERFATPDLPLEEREKILEEMQKALEELDLPLAMDGGTARDRCFTVLAILVNCTDGSTFDPYGDEIVIKAPNEWPDHVWRALRERGFKGAEDVYQAIAACFIPTNFEGDELDPERGTLNEHHGRWTFRPRERKRSSVGRPWWDPIGDGSRYWEKYGKKFGAVEVGVFAGLMFLSCLVLLRSSKSRIA